MLYIYNKKIIKVQTTENTGSIIKTWAILGMFQLFLFQI